MSKTAQLEALTCARPENEPLVFFGPPGHVGGKLRLANLSDAKIRARGLPLDAPDLRGPALLAADTMTTSIRLRPGEQKSVNAWVTLDPATPAGTYEGTITIGDQRVPVVFHVTERVGLRLEPTSMTLVVREEHRFERQLVLDNRGNVPLHLEAMTRAPLLDTSAFAGLTTSVGAPGLPTSQDPAEALKTLVSAASVSTVGEVVLEHEELVLAPGRSHVLPITLTVPKTLEPHRQLRAVFEIYDTDLTINVRAESPATSKKATSNSKKKRSKGS